MSELKKYRDLRLKNFHWLMEELKTEDFKQVDKWGIQVRTLFEWMNYVTEEVGSLAKAISEYSYRDGSKEAIIAEAIQSATLILKIADMVKEEF